MAETRSPATSKGKNPFRKFEAAPAFKKSRRFPKFERVMLPDMDSQDPVLTGLINKLGGNRELAKRILRLQTEFPIATIPELLVMTWLQKEGYSFEFQVEMMGGRNMAGGLVVDFLIPGDGTNATIFQVQGNFWHSISKKGFYDQTSNYRMLGQSARGYTIAKVIEIWESDLLSRYDMVMMYAIAGINLRGIGGV